MLMLYVLRDVAPNNSAKRKYTGYGVRYFLSFKELKKFKDFESDRIRIRQYIFLLFSFYHN